MCDKRHSVCVSFASEFGTEYSNLRRTVSRSVYLHSDANPDEISIATFVIHYTESDMFTMKLHQMLRRKIRDIRRETRRRVDIDSDGFCV